MLDTLEKQTNFRLLGTQEFVATADVELPADLPDGFTEAQVIFREFGSEQGRVTHVDIDEPTPCVNNPNYTGILDFVRKVAAVPSQHVRNRPDDGEATALGIRVTYPSYIVLRIHDDTDWTFSEVFPAVQLQDPVQFPDLYGNLHYVRPDGTTSPRPIPGCRVVFFAAMPTFGDDQNYYIQKLNYYVTDGLNTGQVIDPDIRHPGVGNS
jgi:hypothetical protein